MELAPASFLGGEWGVVQAQLSAASALLHQGLAGADFAFMFQVSLAAGEWNDSRLCFRTMTEGGRWEAPPPLPLCLLRHKARLRAPAGMAYMRAAVEKRTGSPGGRRADCGAAPARAHASSRLPAIHAPRAAPAAPFLSRKTPQSSLRSRRRSSLALNGCESCGKLTKPRWATARRCTSRWPCARWGPTGRPKSTEEPRRHGGQLSDCHLDRTGGPVSVRHEKLVNFICMFLCRYLIGGTCRMHCSLVAMHTSCFDWGG